MDKRDAEGLSLLKKGRRGLVHLLFSRLGIIVLMLLIKLAVITGFFIYFKDYSQYYFIVNLVLSVSVFFHIINSSKIEPVSKLTWLFVISVMPLFGSLLYWYIKKDIGFNALKYRLANILDETDNTIHRTEEDICNLKKENPSVATLADYLNRTGHHPVYSNTKVDYFPLGEDKFRKMLAELRRAEKFIMMEYFIVDEGIMWGRILEILAEKAAQGVEVMVMYDGSNEFTTLPRDYPRRLAKLGIKCKVFAPATPFISTHYNYRDHRKILVIDGKTAFTGGVNLADEYINAYEKYGHWKDTAIMLKGPAVKSFTLMFLQMWNITGQQAEYEKYICADIPQHNAGGYIIPYGDSPLDNEKVGKMVYMDIINRADRYLYIMSPYLILDGDLETALKFAAARGVDVKIILPGIPDKKVPYALAKTHYSSLVSAGVKIYEYTPGFVHAKVFISDDEKAVVGTINLDYRSLYHHFECAAFMYKTDCMPDIVQDFEATLTKCRQVTDESIKKEKLTTKILGSTMKILAPLM